VRSHRNILSDSVQSRETGIVPDTADHDVTVPAANMTAAGYLTLMNQLAPSDTFTNGMHPVINHHLILGRDSVKVVVDSMVRSWLTGLYRNGTPASRQRLNVAAMQFLVDRDADAEQSIAAFLAAPDVTLGDTLLAWRVAVGLFTTTLHEAAPRPERMAIGRRYLQRLEAMPIAVAGGQLFLARFSMMDAFIRTGESDSAVATGLRNFAMASKMPDFEQRIRMVGGSGIYLKKLCQALVGRPRGMARVDSLLTALQQTFIVPPAIAARDTAVVRLAQMEKNWFMEPEAQIRMIGRPAPGLVATHWLNQTPPSKTSTAAPNARELTLDDGTIRIIGLGWFGCPGCMSAMAKLQNDQHLLPKGVELLYYEWTLGSWGSDLVEPEEEVGHLKHYWIERKHYTYPISIWAGPKDSTQNGGLLPRESPTKVALNITEGPTFIVVDGHGIVRYRQAGYYSYQTDFEELIQKLMREQANDAVSSGGSSVDRGTNHDRL